MDFTGPIIGGTVVCVFALIGSLRQAGQALQDKPEDLLTFSTTAPRLEIYQIARRYAQQANMKVEDIEDVSATEVRIILGQNSRGFHNGFWLPIYVRERPGSPTFVEVGIKSKTVQVSFALTMIRNKAAKELKAMLPVV